MDNPLVSVNLLVYNGKEYLKNCIDSVLNQSYKNIEFLIIDNNSNDGSIEFIRDNYPNIKTIEMGANLGFAKGHNLGIEKSSGKYILCLNQDIILDNDFIKNAMDILEKEKYAAAFQGKLLKLKKEGNNFKKTDIIDSIGLEIYKNRRIVSKGQGEKDKNQYMSGAVWGADGAAPIYRRDALEKAKIRNEYFDEDFFMYKEDVDLAWRLRLLGYSAYFGSYSLAWHARSAGESASRKYLKILKERRKIAKLPKYYSWKNQRLMQIKNEVLSVFLKHLPYILIKELLSFVYILFFEQYLIKSMTRFLLELPRAFEKRKIIQKNIKVSKKEVDSWFC